ncbi:hypothetical protein [Carboxydothermus pertinax]|uniref:Uncharacterized protein n=1 Tax=Carboxydothermus pertinax TaxID=870242 RepID=A0A1L8CUZ1_9THEO|nr:hypothetical protein [Carboxydothermus pertinax]GAV22707.1 hypothetical protein cpu_12170 [Carboxydothermus pertinax]
MPKKTEKNNNNNNEKKKRNAMPVEAVTVDDPVTQTLAAKNINQEKQ